MVDQKNSKVNLFDPHYIHLMSCRVFVCQWSCICVLVVVYLCVRGHVFVCQRSCICVLVVMYLCVSGRVFVCQRSCICVLEVMYLCVRGHVFVCQRSCICVLEVSILPLSTILILDFGIVRQCGIFCFSFFAKYVFFTINTKSIRDKTEMVNSSFVHSKTK